MISRVSNKSILQRGITSCNAATVVTKTTSRSIAYTTKKTFNNNNNNNNSNNNNKYQQQYKSISQLFNSISNNGSQGVQFIGLCQQVSNYTVMRQKVGRTMKPNIFIQSPGQLFEPNLPTPLTKVLTTPSSWVDTVKFYYRTYGSISVIKTKLKSLTDEKFTMKSFLSSAKDIFINLNQAIANNDSDEVKDLVTVHYHSILSKNSLNTSSNKKNIKGTWTCELNKPKMVWVRAGQIRTTVSGDMEFFAQICVEFSGKQSLTRTDVKKNTVISQVNDVEFKDIYVFERCLSSLPSSWRICQTVDTSSLQQQ